MHRRPEEPVDDCSRFVAQAVRGAGIPMKGRVTRLWERANQYAAVHYEPVPYIGDLVFFHNTYDSNRNRRVDDLYTHIALETDVHEDGTVEMVHKGETREVIRMNLFRPDVNKSDDGTTLNSWMRKPKAWHPAGTKYLAGELWSGFATIRPGQDWRVWSKKDVRRMPEVPAADDGS